ncbi:hypothetical protein ACIHDR_24185 [Nocardia sp. NPDC052278]|uniref:hypothetical protein n=1 Tax=unclassified Nocardia TaxID=2637762 RepID=UPI0036BFAB9D
MEVTGLFSYRTAINLGRTSYIGKTSDVLLLYTVPEGGTIDDAAFSQQIVDNLNNLTRDYPDQISKVNGGYRKTVIGQLAPTATGTSDKQHAVASVAIKGATIP